MKLFPQIILGITTYICLINTSVAGGVFSCCAPPQPHPAATAPPRPVPPLLPAPKQAQHFPTPPRVQFMFGHEFPKAKGLVY